MAKTHVILSAGHRNTTNGGSAGEAALTLAYADAYARILPEKGFTVHYVQRLKPARGKPDWFAGGLGDVAKKVASIAESLPAGDPVVMIDVHMESPNAGKGIFAIVPDGAGLGDTPANSPDSWANNKKTRKLGRLIVEEISEETGIPMRFSRELGLMSEKQTGVATDSTPARLAMFRNTATLWDRMERIVLEHGNLGADKALLTAPGTPAKCAVAMARALAAHYGTAEPRPPAPFAAVVAPPPIDGADHVVNGREFLACRRRVAIARAGVPALQFADPGAPRVRADFLKGEEFEAAFLVESTAFDGDARWWVAVDGARVPAAGTVQKFTRDW
jgi:hypothetical protein